MVRVRLGTDADSLEETLDWTGPKPPGRPPEATQEDDGGLDEADRDVEVRIWGLVRRHIDALNEVAYPTTAAASRTRLGPVTAVGWREFAETFWKEEEVVPLRLIVRIAEECTATLESVCTRPRRILRRERRLEKLERIQQIDDSCLRWLARQPGRSVAAKAGPRQQAMGVVRLETADTHENRVVHDFLRRCLRAAEEYIRDNMRHSGSERVKLLLRFRSRLRLWLTLSPIGSLPLPTGVPAPNYALQFDERYRRIWQWYDRLRRQQDEYDAAWAWQHRVWTEHSRLAWMEALDRLQDPERGLRGRLLLRTEPTAGTFVDPRSAIGAWMCRSGGRLWKVHAACPPQLEQAAEVEPLLEPVAAMGPDLLVWAGEVGRADRAHRLLALWCTLAPASSTGFRDAAMEALGAAGVSDATAVLVAPILTRDPGDVEQAVMRERVEERRRSRAVEMELPLPLSKRLTDIRRFVEAWLGGRP